jgi:hypothetical protein
MLARILEVLGVRSRYEADRAPSLQELWVDRDLEERFNLSGSRRAARAREEGEKLLDKNGACADAARERLGIGFDHGPKLEDATRRMLEALGYTR